MKDIKQDIETCMVDPLTREILCVSFRLDEYVLALPVGIVERVIRAVYITPVHGAPDHVSGVINVQGRLVPVFSLRKIFGLPAREIQPADKLILSRTAAHTVAFDVDEVLDVMHRKEQDKITAGKVFAGLERNVEGMIFSEDGIIMIYSLDHLLSVDISRVLDLAGLVREKAKRMKKK